MKELIGRNILITGASRGLGLHIAKALWQQGANLFLIARQEGALIRVQEELAATGLPGQKALHYAVDLQRPEAAAEVISSCRHSWEQLHGLVNNAGILGPIGRIWETEWSHWQEVLEVNLHTPVKLCRLALPWMVKSGGGSIINLSGGGGTGPRPRFAPYAVSKSGMIRFSEILAAETEELNIRVNCIAPGALNTEMLETVLQSGPELAGKKEYEAALQQQKTGGADPSQASALCVFLISGASRGITGRLLSAAWDNWRELPLHIQELRETDIYTLRRIIPPDRGKEW